MNISLIMAMKEIFGKTTVYKNKITIPKDMRKYFHIKDGDKFIWGINKEEDLILRRSTFDRMNIEKRFYINE